MAKIELKKMCGGENKKYRRVGNECRLTRCPFEIWSVCWSSVKMVWCIIVQFLVVCLSMQCRLIRFLPTINSRTYLNRFLIHLKLNNND